MPSAVSGAAAFRSVPLLSMHVDLPSLERSLRSEREVA
jgi:hypothetical protein